jgi:hypothetical protein
MISAMLSWVISKKIAQGMGKIGVFCDIEYDIILFFMISCMISWILHDIMVAQGMGKT